MTDAEKQVRLKEEEIAWMESRFWPNPTRNAIPIRIHAVLQAQLTELKKGLK